MTSADVITYFYPGMGPGAVRESIINGIWYEAIRKHFPYPHFIIAPNFYTINNTRVDLCVLQPTNHGLRPVFAFDGMQGPMPPSQWSAAVGHAAGYLSCMTQLSNGRQYGMVASGSGYIILEYTAVGGMHMVLKVTGGNLVIDKSHETIPWDAQAHAAEIDVIFDAIAHQIANTR